MDQTDAQDGMDDDNARTERDEPGESLQHGSSDSLPTLDLRPGGLIDASAGTLDYVADGRGLPDVLTGATAPRNEIYGCAETPKFSVGGYDLLATLGRGAMGVVYLAQQRGLKRLVALKMISAGALASGRERARFRSEAEAAAQLQHTNIVQIYEIGEHDGQPFFSLEFVNGGNLGSKIKGTPQPPRQAAEIVRTLALAMDFAHQHNVIHRDLKPSNILLTSDSIPKIADFGLAKSLEEESIHTQTGTILGTPSYMSPEQASGKTKDIGPAADIYALGAILYDLLTGRPPFRGTSLWETVRLVKTQEPVPPRHLQPNIPVDLETICLKCLQKEPQKRYARAADLAEDLRRFLAGEAIRARPISAPERLWRWCRRNPRLAILHGVVASLVVVWAVSSTVLYFQVKEEKEATERQRQIALHNEQVARDNEKQARKNADALRLQFLANVSRVHELVEKLHARLTPKTGPMTNPETDALRQEILELARLTMMGMANDFSTSGISPFGMVLVHQKMGELFRKLGQGEASRQQYQLGVEAARHIAREHPDDDIARGNLALMLNKLGEATLEFKGDVPAALACFREAFELQERLVAHLPSANTAADKKKIADVHRNLRAYHNNLAYAAGLMWDPAASRKCLEVPFTFWKARAAADPKDQAAQSYLAQMHSLLGDACSWCGDRDGCLRHHEAAVALSEALVRDHPRDRSFRADLVLVCLLAGDAHLRHGDLKTAGELYLQHLPALELVARQKPGDLWLQLALAQAYQRSGEFSLRQGQTGPAADHFARALQGWEKLAKARPDNIAFQAARCVVLAHCGKSEPAREAAEALLHRAPNRPEALLAAARCFALCAADATSEDQPMLTERVVQLLVQAVEQGYHNDAALRDEAEWPGLAANAGFRQLLQRLRKTAPGA
jgi:tetratricopeptide (TPR) repeat protein/predicted Ser/Thr protein kinase